MGFNLGILDNKNLITVGENGCNFTDLQEAYDHANSIGVSGNEIVVALAPGVYTGNFTCNAYVSTAALVTTPNVVKLTSDSGSTLKISGSGNVDINNITIETTGINGIALEIEDTDVVFVDGYIRGTVEKNATLVKGYGDGSLLLGRSSCFYTSTGNSPTALVHKVFDFSDNFDVTQATFELQITITGDKDDVYAIYDNATKNNISSVGFISIYTLSSSYTGTVYGYYGIKSSLYSKLELPVLFTILGNGATGSAYAIYIDTDGDNGVLNLNSVDVYIAGYNIMKAAYAESGDTIDLAFVKSNLSDPFGGSGTINGLSMIQNGSLFTYGNSRVYEDVINSSFEVVGIENAPYEIFRNDGNSGQKAIDFDGVNQYGKVNNYSNLDVSLDSSKNGDMSIEFWFKPQEDVGYILGMEDYFDISFSWGSLVFTFGNLGWDVWINNKIVNNQKYHIVITIKNLSSSKSRVKVYINGARVYNRRLYGVFQSFPSNDLYFGGNVNEDYADMIEDTTTLYNIVLSASQVNERYNSGDGTETLPTGVTEATDVMANFNFNEGSGSTVDNDCSLGAGQDMTLYNSPSWVDGLIGSSAGLNGSIGVAAPVFYPDKLSSRFFNSEVPHAYDEGTDIEPHIHICGSNNDTGVIRFGIEYTFTNIGDTFPTTQTIYKEYTMPGVGYQHILLSFGLLNCSGKRISSINCVRVFRDGEHANDTYTGKIYLVKVSSHIYRNSQGSRLIYQK